MARRKAQGGSDTTVVALWKQLIYHGFDGAAVGLLGDVFDWIVTDEQYDRWSSELDRTLRPIIEEALVKHGICQPPTPPHELTEEQVRRIEDGRRCAIEDAMIMLDDQDGDKLRDWLVLYVSDNGAWKNRALSWVEACREKEG
jgi:hypothetical protein